MPSSLSTPSLGITEIEKELERIDEEFLSTPSLGITIHFEDDIYNFCYAIFQLPLSGSHATVPSRPSDRSLGLFQLPLSGSLGSGDVARQIIRRLLLSTPSLGITWWQQSSSG